VLLLVFYAIYATTGQFSDSTSGQTVVETDDLPMVINRQNYGYMLRKVKKVTVATYVAKMVFHIDIPQWNVTFDDRLLQCNEMEDRPKIQICQNIERILNVLKDLRVNTQEHVQNTVRRIHEVVADLPKGKRRQRRGIFTNFLSSVTGLATKDQVNSLKTILERVEVGIHTSAEMFGRGTKDLVASFKVTQSRLDNIKNVLGIFRKTLYSVQRDVVLLQHADEAGFKAMGEVLRWMRKSYDEVAEADRLYMALQMLVGGEVPHYLIPHEVMVNSLTQIEEHLQNTTNHMTLVRHDFGYYYSEAPLQTFVINSTVTIDHNKPNYLILVIDVPVTVKPLRQPFVIYETIYFPLPTPQENHFYSMLATDIGFLAFNKDLDFILQIKKGQILPISEVWLHQDIPGDFLDRHKHTCASALIDGNLVNIKQLCRYGIFPAPYPRSVVRLYNNTYLLTNISVLQMHCVQPTLGKFHAPMQTLHLTQIQSIHSFDCHCDFLAADEYRIITDQQYCNEQMDISSVQNIKFTVNLPYLSAYFTAQELIDLSMDIKLNESIRVEVPELALEEKEWDMFLAKEDKGHYDMETMINRTKHDAKSYDDLSHYLFNKIVKANLQQPDFDPLSPFSWITIAGWLISCFALVLAIFLQLKVRTLSLLLLPRSVSAIPLPPLVLKATYPPTTMTPAFDHFNNWIDHIQHVPNLLPVELLILLLIFFFVIMFSGKRIFNQLKTRFPQWQIKTALFLEIGNLHHAVTIPIFNSTYPPTAFRFLIQHNKINLVLVEHVFSSSLFWTQGIEIYNQALGMNVEITQLLIRWGKAKALKSLLNGRHYVTILVFEGQSLEISHIVTLRSFQSAAEPPADEYEMRDRMSYPNQNLPFLINKM